MILKLYFWCWKLFFRGKSVNPIGIDFQCFQSHSLSRTSLSLSICLRSHSFSLLWLLSIETCLVFNDCCYCSFVGVFILNGGIAQGMKKIPNDIEKMIEIHEIYGLALAYIMFAHCISLDRKVFSKIKIALQTKCVCTTVLT